MHNFDPTNNVSWQLGHRGRVAVFIDGNNLFHTARFHNIDIDYNKLLRVLLGDGRLLRAFFYTGVDVGSFPIDIGREPGSGPPTLRQWFQAPTGQGTLEIRAQDLKGLVVHVNEQFDIVLREDDLAAEVVRVDLASYLVAGLNVVQYNPVGRRGSTRIPAAR